MKTHSSNLQVVCAANPRYFADASGRPVYLTGSHTWQSLQDGIRSIPMVFPGKDWNQATPESQGIDSARLRAALDYLARSLAEHGGADTVFIVRNGYAIWQAPECDREFLIFSATKFVTSTMLGLLIDDGKVTSDTFADSQRVFYFDVPRRP